MKSCSSFPHWKVFLTAAVLSTSLGALRVEAVAVDTELVVLVDAQASLPFDFDLILEGVAQAFEQQSFIDSVVGGPNGRIAATLILFNSNNGETVGIPWMELSSAQDLTNFAGSVRNVSNATPFGGVDYAGAISEGAAQIASSAFEGAVRQLTIIDDGTGFFGPNRSGTQAARDAALASSVDVINAVVFDAQFQVDTVEEYYNTNVVGGPGGTVDVVASSQGGIRSSAVSSAIEASITSAVTTPTVAAAAAVPEPSSLFLILGSGLTLLVRRKR